MKNSAEQTRRIVKDLSGLLMKEMELLAGEQRFPGMSADDSDRKMKEGAERIKELRAIRDRVEVIMTGVLL